MPNPKWSSLKSQIIKAHAFELVHIEEEDERLDRREIWWKNNDIKWVWYLGLNRTVAKDGWGAGGRKGEKE